MILIKICGLVLAVTLKKIESPDECLLREVKEETGLTLTSYKMRGILTFVYRDICEYVCLYTADGFEGEMTSCNEGELKWVPKDKLLTLNLFEGDLIFFQAVARRCTILFIETHL